MSRAPCDGALVHARELVVGKAPAAAWLGPGVELERYADGAVAWIDGQTYLAPMCELDVFDRVGGGDSFASGLFYGLLSGETPEESVKIGWAHGALATTFPGDTTMATLDQVRAFAKGGTARIQR